MANFNIEKYLSRSDRDSVTIQKEDFEETEKELVELVNKSGSINNVQFQVSTGVVAGKSNEGKA